jgi:beta-N-acetylhexosaminidase
VRAPVINVLAVVLAAAVATAAAGCTSAESGSPSSTGAAVSSPGQSSPAQTSPGRSSSAPSSPSATHASPDGAAHSAEAVLAAMSEAERVGQLLMVDCPSTEVAAQTVTDITTHHVGSVILDGNSSLSVTELKSLTRQLQSHAPSTAGLLISTDQEGGLVRRLRGSGFAAMPSAVVQGGYAVSALRTDAAEWGRQLAAAGINVDLAPVLDTVPAGSTDNPPIGDLDREYGHDPATVASHGTAVAQGLASAGVAATVKHFPGLGRVTGNTDTTSGVTDSVTTATDPYLAPFATAIDAAVPFVMMSTAIYSRIDPTHPAAFSSKIIGSILRGSLHFTGVVISDDLGAAQQVSGYSIADRAIDFIAAGGDIVLTVVASQAATMTSALLQRAQSDPSFKAKVDAAALAVLTEKQALGLLN